MRTFSNVSNFFTASLIQIEHCFPFISSFSEFSLPPKIKSSSMTKISRPVLDRSRADINPEIPDPTIRKSL